MIKNGLKTEIFRIVLLDSLRTIVLFSDFNLNRKEKIVSKIFERIVSLKSK